MRALTHSMSAHWGDATMIKVWRADYHTDISRPLGSILFPRWLRVDCRSQRALVCKVNTHRIFRCRRVKMILVLLATISCCYTYNLLKLPSAHTYVRPMLLFGVMQSPSHSATTPEDVRPKTSRERERERERERALWEKEEKTSRKLLLASS